MALVEDKRVALRAAVAAAAADSPQRSAAEAALSDEEAVREEWTQDNIRRRHNYVPLAFNVIMELAKANQLAPLVDAAKTRTTERLAAARKKREEKK
jgi:ubiquitin carboxyl-terminal hydrolase L5